MGVIGGLVFLSLSGLGLVWAVPRLRDDPEAQTSFMAGSRWYEVRVVLVLAVFAGFLGIVLTFG